ncbi:MAG: hypothetical protein ACI3ZT_06780 [Candidatus Cryptobacteroides sp.]
MKNILKLWALAAVLVGFQACSEDHSYEDESDPVLSYYQIVGTWKLTEWNGEDMESGDRYVYMVLESKERTFKIYQNIESAQPREMTGTFELVYDDEACVNIVSGMYDHEFGFWNNDYIVTKKDEDTMIWTVSGNPSDVSVYRRYSVLE